MRIAARVCSISIPILGVFSLANVARADDPPAVEETPPSTAGAPVSGEAAPTALKPSAEATPAAGPARPFAAPGRVVLDEVFAARSSGLPVTVGWFAYRASTQEPDGGMKTTSTSLRFAPSADVFVIEGFSVGGQIAMMRERLEVAGIERTTIVREVAPRVGYAFPIGEALVFWPRIHGAYGWSDTETERPGAIGGVGVGGVGGAGGAGALGFGEPSRGQYWRVGGDASLLFPIGRHVVIGAGPAMSFTRQKSGSPSTPIAVATSFDVSLAASLRLAL